MQTVLVVVASLSPSVAAGQGDAAVHRIERDGLKLELAPLTREQARAFILGRGFDAADADFAFATGCIHRSAIGNAYGSAGGPEIRVLLTEWRVLAEGRDESPPLVRADWDRIWQGRGLVGAPAVAFHWALFPAEQVFAPIDHNWGFITPGLPPGTRFSLDVSWRHDGQLHRHRIDGLECAS
ncbi:MAG: hypothetical protein AB7E80_08460 [Hyphomicrobiaceae bacterium]